MGEKYAKKESYYCKSEFSAMYTINLSFVIKICTSKKILLCYFSICYSFFAILLAFMQKCPKCKKMIGNRYAIANGEEKFFWLFPKKCPYCDEPFVSEKKKK